MEAIHLVLLVLGGVGLGFGVGALVGMTIACRLTNDVTVRTVRLFDRHSSER